MSAFAISRHLNTRIGALKKVEERTEIRHVISALRDLKDEVEDKWPKDKRNHDVGALLKELDIMIEDAEQAEEEGAKFFENVALDEDKLNQELDSFLTNVSALAAKIDREVSDKALRTKFDRVVKVLIGRAFQAKEKGYDYLKEVYKRVLAATNEAHNNGIRENMVSKLVQSKKQESVNFGDYITTRWDVNKEDRNIKFAKKSEGKITGKLTDTLQKLKAHKETAKQFKKEISDIEKQGKKLIDAVNEGFITAGRLMKRAAWFDIILMHLEKESEFEVNKTAKEYELPLVASDEFIKKMMGQEEKEEKALRAKAQTIRIEERALARKPVKA